MNHIVDISKSVGISPYYNLPSIHNRLRIEYYRIFDDFGASATFMEGAL